MKRIAHKLVNIRGWVQATIILPEGEPFTPEPWMRHKIETEGWGVVAQPIPDSGLSDHGWADWSGVADNLAMAMRALLDPARTQNDDADEQLLEQAQAALDDYETAVMEVGLAQVHEFEDDDAEEDDDGQG